MQLTLFPDELLPSVLEQRVDLVRRAAQTSEHRPAEGKADNDGVLGERGHHGHDVHDGG